MNYPKTDEEFLIHYGIFLPLNPTKKQFKEAMKEAYQRMYNRIVNKTIRTLEDLYQ